DRHAQAVRGVLVWPAVGGGQPGGSQPGHVTGQDGPGHLGSQRHQAHPGRLQGCQSQLHPSQDSRRGRAAANEQPSAACTGSPLTYAGKYLHNVGVAEDDAVFKALADPTRRALLDQLRERNGQTLGELCEPLDMARQSATQHLGLLESANLVTTVRRGREKLHYLNPVPLWDIAERWIEKFERPRLRALSAIRHRAEEGVMAERPEYVYVAYIESTSERVWNALTDADLTAEYWGHSNVSDWQPGSPWEHRRVDGSGIADVAGTVLESMPPARLRRRVPPGSPLTSSRTTRSSGSPSRTRTWPTRARWRLSPPAGPPCSPTSSRCWRRATCCRARRGRCTPRCGPRRWPATTARPSPARSPQRGRPEVAEKLSGHVDRDRHRQHVDVAVRALGGPDTVRRHRRGGSAPPLPAARGVEAGAVRARAERAEVVGGPHDALERGHQPRAVTLAAP